MEAVLNSSNIYDRQNLKFDLEDFENQIRHGINFITMENSNSNSEIVRETERFIGLQNETVMEQTDDQNIVEISMNLLKNNNFVTFECLLTCFGETKIQELMSHETFLHAFLQYKIYLEHFSDVLRILKVRFEHFLRLFPPICSRQIENKYTKKSNANYEKILCVLNNQVIASIKPNFHEVDSSKKEL